MCFKKSKLTLLLIIEVTLLIICSFHNIVRANCTSWDISASESDNVTATLNGDTLTISGTGKMKNYTFDEDTEWSASVGDGVINKIVIENGVTNIGDYMAHAIGSLTSVEIPETVTIIGEEAFSFTGLESITIPESVLFIGDGAFAYSDLKSIEIPYNVISVGAVAFVQCPLTNVRILNGDTILLGESIDLGPFELLDVNIEQPERKTTVKTLPTKTEYKCGEEIKLDGGVIQINVDGEETKEISMTNANIEYIVEDYDFGANKQDVIVIYTEGEDKYFTYFTTKIYDYIVDLSVSNLPKAQYKYGDALDLTNGKIKYETFLGNTKEISMTDSKVEVIGYDATKLGKQTLTVKYTPNKETYTTTFEVEVTEAAKYDISKNNDGSIMATLVGNTLSISGKGEMKNYGVDEEEPISLPWESDIDKIEQIIIYDGVTNIGDCAFLECTNLKTVTIPDSVTKIGYGAFAYCESIKSINIPESVTSIGYSAFYYCEALVNINLPKNITKIESGLFYECRSVVNIEIPEKVTSIGDYAFDGCGSLTNINLSDSLQEIGKYAFFGCKINDIELPSNLQTIGEAAFRSCSITQIRIPASVQVIGHSAFACCMNLKNIEVESGNKNYLSENGVLFDINKTKLIQYNIASERTIYSIPKGVKIIGESSFNGAKNIEKLEVPSSITEVLGWYGISGGGPVTYAFDNYMSEVFYDGAEYELRNVKYCTDSYADINGLHAWDNVHYNSIIDAEKSSIEASYEYTGSEIKPSITLETWKGKLIEGNDYKIIYEDNINVGTAVLTVVGIGEHEGEEAYITFDITAKSIEDATIEGVEDKTYTGNSIEQDITIKLGNITLVNGKDYEINYKNNTNAGTATIEIKGIGNYTGTISRNFTIIENYIKGIQIKSKPTKTVYKFAELLDLAGGKIQINMAYGEPKELSMLDTNVMIGGYDFAKIGEQEIIVTYRGFTSKFTVVVEDYVWGIAVIEVPEIVYQYGKDLDLRDGKIAINMASGITTELSMQDKNVKVTGYNPTKTGEQSLKVEYKGLTTSFSVWVIERIDIAECAITGIYDETYTGKNIIQDNLVITTQEHEILHYGGDYTISYSNNKNPGKATITIKGVGAYKGTVKKTFIIKPKKVTGFKVKEQKTDSIKLSWSKHTGVTGYKIYSYNYKKSKWEYVGKTSSTSYTIKKLKAGTTYKYRVRAYKTVDGTQYFGSYTSSLKTSTKTKTPSISKLTTKSKKATIKWKKVSGASGYQIYMATSKNGKYSKIKTITKGSTTSYTKTKLKKNKKYYFKIRTYRTVDGKKVYSSYSSVKSIKVK